MRIFANEDEALAFLMNELPWGNAGNTGKDPKILKRYHIPHVEFGSMMPHQWDGNPGDNFYYSERFRASINALGIPDAGYEVHIPVLVELRRDLNAESSQLWGNISGRTRGPFNPYEFHDMARTLRGYGAVDGVLGNFACANQAEEGSKRRKPVICFDFALFEEAVAALKEGAGNLPTKVKVAAFTDPSFIERWFEICDRHGITYIVTSNTMGNCYLEKAEGVPAIDMKRGGLGGEWIWPVVAGMVTQLREMIGASSSKLKIIWVGGITTGEDAYTALRLGADGFAFNTALTTEHYDPLVIEELIFGDAERGQKGLLQLLVEKGLPDRFTKAA